MADESQEHTPSTSSLPVRLRKLLITIAALFVLWVVFRYAGGAMFLQPPRTGAPTAPVQAESQFHPGSTLTERDEKIAALESRLNQLEAKLKAFEDVVTASPRPAEPSEETDIKIAELEAKLDELRQQPVSLSDEDTAHVARMDKRIAAQHTELTELKNQLTSVASRGSHEVAVITSFTQMKEAAMAGKPYRTELARLQRLTQDRPSVQPLLAALDAAAEKGLPTRHALLEAFDTTVPQALSGGKAGFLGNNLKSLIRIRKVGAEQLGSDDEAVIARAENMLENGDMAGCLKELARLSPPAATAFASWAARAEGYRKAQDSINALEIALLQNEPPAEPAPAPVTTAPIVEVEEPLPVPPPPPAQKRPIQRKPIIVHEPITTPEPTPEQEKEEEPSPEQSPEPAPEAEPPSSQPSE